mgnify:CR=1 FL=1
MMLKLNIEIEGTTEWELEVSLREVARVISDGFTSGSDGDDDRRYRFEIVEVSPDRKAMMEEEG